MGHGVGAVLAAFGHRVVAPLSDRSDGTRRRAQRAGIEDVGDVAGAVAAADLVLSILPPAAAEETAAAFADAAQAAGRQPLFVDCNAVSPGTARRIEKALGPLPFVDGGIVGGRPRPGGPATRLYVSGARAQELVPLAGDSDAGALAVRVVSERIGDASALKMAYAGLTKGTMTLHAAVLLAAERLGVREPLEKELAASQAEAWKRMGVLPFLPADAERWIGEMQEIAATFRGAGLPGEFHDAAEAIFRLLARTPWSGETRETLDRSRTLDETIRTLAKLLD